MRYGALIGSPAPARRDFVDAWLSSQAAADVGPRPQLPLEAVPTTSTSSIEEVAGERPSGGPLLELDVHARHATSTNRRRRRRLALARELDDTPLGPDESEVVFSWDDGWTVRRVRRLADQRREGLLVRHCGRRLSTPLPGEHSLRDEENLPYVTFCIFRLEGGGAAIEQALTAAVAAFLNIELMGDETARFLAVVNLYHPGATPHLERVREFVTGHRETFPTLPATPRGAMGALTPFIAQVAQLMPQPRDPRAGWYWELLRRVEADSDLEATVWPRRISAR